MDTIKKILTTGVGAALMTESGLRQVFADMQPTKQARDYLIRQLLKSKDEILKLVLSEIKKFLQKVDIHEEVRKAMEGMTLEINATVTVKGKGRSLSTQNLRIKSLGKQK